MKPVTVLTCDVIASRSAVWSGPDLIARMDSLSEPWVLAPFSLFRGDEIQAVLEGWLEHASIVRRLRHVCRPLEIRVGIGLGGLDEGVLKAEPWAMNGEPFFRARNALTSLKRFKHPVTAVASGNDSLDEMVNCIWMLVDSVERSWTDKQWEAVWAYERYGSYARAAQALGVRLQNVQKRCKAARWNEIRRAEQVLSHAYSEALAHPDCGEVRQITPERVNRG